MSGQTSEVPTLSFNDLKSAIEGNAAAFRVITKLLPAGGPGSKVFPPTYAGGVYAMEQRRINGEVVPCVLLDSVQSQANRIEEALLAAGEAGALRFPLMVVDFSKQEDGSDQSDKEIARIGRITTLDVPHRIADAILRESLRDGKPFRESDEGKAFEAANIRNATALFELCPTALILGTWDSTGSRGGLGNKFARALVSELIGVNAVSGRRTGGRRDPLIESNPDIYKTAEGDWTPRADRAERDDAGKPVKFGKKLSELNLGNVTPDLARASKDAPTPNKRDYIVRADEVLPGGVTMDYALQTTVLSLPALRRLRFPDTSGKTTAERNNAARTALAALALAGAAHFLDAGCDLRSRCLLIPDRANGSLELLGSNGEATRFLLTAGNSAALFDDAVAAAKSSGVTWRDEKPIDLWPSSRLIDLIRAGRGAEIAAED